MKKDIPLEISKTEAIVFILLLCWIIASCFVPLPEVNSLGS
ncbi:MAG: hypothetical protein NTX08_00285 [Sphingobacteriales bacterium]|jgi:hypothetical protein|nr:hypothetical protein [Sphingobacteriales bacterium]